MNVPQANIDWWYAAIYTWDVGTFRKFRGSVNDTVPRLSLQPNPQTFDVASALSEETWTSYEAADPENPDMTWIYWDTYAVTPSATITSVVSRTGYSPVPATGVIPEQDVGLYEIPYAIGPATIDVVARNKTVFIA